MLTINGLTADIFLAVLLLPGVGGGGCAGAKRGSPPEFGNCRLQFLLSAPGHGGTLSPTLSGVSDACSSCGPGHKTLLVSIIATGVCLVSGGGPTKCTG